MTPRRTLLARGEDADVFAIDETRVLRRYRRRAVPEGEVAIMRYVREHGYPVPAVFDVSGPDLTLERIAGPTMLADLRRRPWRYRTHALTLARLHRELHAIPPPDFLRGEGAAVLHLDLHPANVMLAPHGPVVIDWANAARGDAPLDVALTAVVLAGAPVGPPLSWLRDWFVRAFLGEFALAEWRVGFDRALAYRRADGNVSAKERRRLTKLRL
ncbi:MAG TPA: phosphotransferase [Candidatus Udaeobacter sp.]|nr:phosphotransferase [Candidatus Udaeobacter sp.]